MRFRSSKAVLGVAALAAMLAFGTTASAAPISKCNAAKKKCLGKYIAAVMGCHAKAEGKSLPVDGNCLSKAAAKITGAGKGCFDKNDAKNDGCSLTGDAAAQLAKADAFILDVVTEIDPSYPAPHTNKCDAAKKKCVGKKASGLMGCEAKANKDGVGDPACTPKVQGKFSNVDGKGCFDKALAKNDGPCSVLGDTIAIEAKVDAWVADAVGDLDTPPVPTPTPTATPGVGCGNGVLDAGEDCDPAGGAPTSCQIASNTSAAFTCSPTCTCACPTMVTFSPDKNDPSSLLDIGWTGIAHSSGTIDNLVTATVSGCAGSSRPCGQCNLGGPVENVGTNVFKSRRCTNDTSIKCTSNTPCTAGGGTCQFYFGPALPLSSGGVATCTVNEVAGSLTGTANIETGASVNELNLTAHVFIGITVDVPCPQCLGDGTPNDGTAGGTCSGGDRNGLDCDVHGVSPNVSFGATSLDCPPTAGANVANLAVKLSGTTGTSSKTLTAGSPNCRALGYTGNKCFCDTCNSAAAEPCSSNADCLDPPGPIGPICGGKRCSGGTNHGQACTVGSECPSGSCTIPGTPTAVNACLPPDGAPDGCQPVGNNRGLCVDGPTDNNCAAPEQHRGCISGGDCPVTGTCVSKNRECFLDMGLLAGTGDCAGGSNEGALCTVNSECPGGICQQRGELIAQGAADVPMNDASQPTIASIFCVGPTGAAAVNNVAGLPGPARLRLRGAANGLP